MDDELIVQLYWDRSENAILETDRKYGAYCDSIAYLAAGFPVFAATVDGEYAGYVVCRVDSEVVWVESIFVKEEYRRHGVATALHSKAEKIAASYGEETVYNYVHPNNHRMIAFLRKRGYTVLNLIEIRKPYAGEKTTQIIKVGENEFDY